MGFYLRKSVRVGPFRFNLSKSGVGVSAGVRGFRIGMGPRGNYVHVGRGGLYFRRSLNLPPAGQPSAGASPTPVRPAATPDSTVGPMEDIESADVLKMVDSSASELLDEINSKMRETKLLPVATLLAAIGLLALMSVGTPGWGIGLWVVAALAAVALARYRDELARSVVILFDLDDSLEQAYQSLHGAFAGLAQCARVWHIPSSGQVRNSKYHAGADHVVKRTRVWPSKGQPPLLKTNIEVPILDAGKQKLAFMPDRLLVFETRAVGAVPYDELHVQLGQSRFVEEEGVPRDAEVVGHTWRYVNKNGGPDRRFRDNTQLPVALYEDMHFTSPTGLNELFQLSRAGAGGVLKFAVERLADRLAEVQSVGSPDAT